MPIFPGITIQGIPDDTEQGIQKRNQASPAALYSLHFMDRAHGIKLTELNTGDPEAIPGAWGPRLFAYQDLTMPGFEAGVLNPTTVDNFTGWAPPIVISRTPVPRDVVTD